MTDSTQTTANQKIDPWEAAYLRFETPEEIAAVVAFIASVQSASINGAAVRADGGVVRSIL